MVTENSTAPFSVIGPQRKLPDGLIVFKLFSRQPLLKATLEAIFQDLEVLAERCAVLPPYSGIFDSSHGGGMIGMYSCAYLHQWRKHDQVQQMKVLVQMRGFVQACCCVTARPWDLGSNFHS